MKFSKVPGCFEGKLAGDKTQTFSLIKNCIAHFVAVLDKTTISCIIGLASALGATLHRKDVLVR